MKYSSYGNKCIDSFVPLQQNTIMRRGAVKTGFAIRANSSRRNPCDAGIGFPPRNPSPEAIQRRLRSRKMMRNLLAMVGAATIAFVGLGWYFGWYKLTRQPATPGTQRFSVDLSPDKIATDGKKFIDHTGELIGHLGESGGDSTESKTQPQPTFSGTAPQFSSPSSGAPATGQSTNQKSPNMLPAPSGTIQPVGATSPRP